MFHIIDSKSFKSVSEDAHTSHSSSATSTAPPYSVRTPIVTDRNIVIGASNRSRSGCLVCRRRKKKCDETYPVCDACKLRKVACEWGPNKPSGLKYDSGLPSSNNRSKVSKLNRNKTNPPKNLTSILPARSNSHNDVVVPTFNIDSTAATTSASASSSFPSSNVYSDYPYDRQETAVPHPNSLHRQHQQSNHYHKDDLIINQKQNHLQCPQNHSLSQDLYFGSFDQFPPHQSQTNDSVSTPRSQLYTQLNTQFDPPSRDHQNSNVPVLEPLVKASPHQSQDQKLHSQSQPQVIEELYTPNAHQMVSKAFTPSMGSLATFFNNNSSNNTNNNNNNGSISPWLNSAPAPSLFPASTTPTSFDLETMLSLYSQEQDSFGAIPLDLGMEDQFSSMASQQLLHLLGATSLDSFDSNHQATLQVFQFLQRVYFLLSPSSIINPTTFNNLDEMAMHFMHSFVEKVARELCIGPESSNYLLRTFFKLAGKERSISYALSSWGGVFLNDEGSKQYVAQYREKANELMTLKRSRGTKHNKDDTYVYLNYNMIQMSIDVCAGDTKVWHDFFKENVKLIQKEGGLEKMCEKFDYSEDILWLLADVQYHDILSSKTFSEGTIFKIKDYNKIFSQNKDQNHKRKNSDLYGIDPLQGCLQPIFLILGGILNDSVKMKRKYEMIRRELDKAEAQFETTGHIKDLNPIVDSQSTNMDHYSCNNNPELLSLRAQRIKFFSEVEELYNGQKSKIKSCSPMQLNLHDLQNDTKVMELHQTLFKIYVQIVTACLEIQLRRAPSGSYELQCLLPQIFVYIDMLVDTKMASSLCLAFLICGIICIEPGDRHYLEHQYGKIKKNYHVKNFERTWEIVEEIWKRNDNGRKYIDWIDICEEKGWILCLS